MLRCLTRNHGVDASRLRLVHTTLSCTYHLPRCFFHSTPHVSAPRKVTSPGGAIAKKLLSKTPRAATRTVNITPMTAKKLTIKKATRVPVPKTPSVIVTRPVSSPRKVAAAASILTTTAPKLPKPPPAVADAVTPARPRINRPEAVPNDQPTTSQPMEQWRCARPDDAEPGVAYARYPDSLFSHYIIGSDGSVRNSAFLMNRLAGYKKHMNVMLELRSGSSDAHPEGELPQVKEEQLSHAVLLAHGHPKPHPHSIVRHRDMDTENCALQNLHWETTQQVLRHEIAESRRLNDGTLEFTQDPRFPSYWIGNDGRVWSCLLHGWMRGQVMHGQLLYYLYLPKNAATQGLTRRQREVRIFASKLVWSAFNKQPLLDGQRLKFKDGDSLNARLDNLQIVLAKPARGKTKATKPSARR